MPEGSIITPVSSPSIDPYQARVGAWLKDKWRLDRLLGVGGMAAVYEATHRNGKRAAIKVLHVQLSVDAEIRARFLREGYVANRVEHPGAVSVLDDDVADDGAFYLVMELLSGETLEDRVKRAGRIDRGEALFVVGRLLEVLAAAHEKGIVHRDIKPENVFLTDDGGVKVLDFGIARLRELSAGGDAARPGTQTGLAMGTPGFMPPEQARGRWDEVDARSDLWAVGAMLFSLLVGRPVHEAQTVNELLLAAMTTPAPPLTTVLPDASSELCVLVDRSLAYKKEERFEGARAMLEQLKKAQLSLGLTPLVNVPITPRPPELSSPAPLAYTPGAPSSLPYMPGAPASLPDPREAVFERSGPQVAMASATTLPASEVLRRSAADDAPEASPSSAEPEPKARRGGAAILGFLLLVTAGSLAGAMIAYPDAPITLKVRGAISPLLLQGARAIAPAPSGGVDGAPPELSVSPSTQPADSAPPAATQAPPPSATQASAATPAPTSTTEAPASSAGSAGSTGDAPPSSSASSSSSASAPSSSAPHTTKAAAKAEPPHGSKSKPKWSPPPPTPKKKTKH